MKKRFCLFLAAAFLVPLLGAADQSRTTEYHNLSLAITADKVMTIVLPDGYFLSGAVKDTAGSPVPGAVVSAVSPVDKGFGWAGTADAAGLFSFPVQKGIYTVIVHPPMSASIAEGVFSRLIADEVEGVTVASDRNMGEVRLPNGVILRGKIIPPSGKIGTLAAVLMAFPTVANAETKVYGAQFGTGPDSTKYAMALPVGAHKLIFYPIMVLGSTYQSLPMTFKTDRVTISGDMTKDIRAPKGFKIWGTVKDKAGVKLNGIVAVFQKTNPFVKGMPVAEFVAVQGSYSGYLPAGAYVLVFQPYPPLNTGYMGRATRTSFNLTMPAAAKQLNLVALNGVIFSGKVVNARNQVVKAADVGVIVTDAVTSPVPADWLWYMTATDAQGKFRLPVPKDTYEIHAFPLDQTAVAAGADARPSRILRMTADALRFMRWSL